MTSGPWHPAVKLREDPLGGRIFSALLAGGHDGVVGHDLRWFRVDSARKTHKKDQTIKENTMKKQWKWMDWMEIQIFDVQFTLPL